MSVSGILWFSRDIKKKKRALCLQRIFRIKIRLPFSSLGEGSGGISLADEDSFGSVRDGWVVVVISGTDSLPFSSKRTYDKQLIEITERERE